MNAVLVVDKPSGPTSHDVVARVLGRMTRLAQFYTSAEKAYAGEIRLGFATDTYDAQGERVGDVAEVHVAADEVCAAAAKFVGEIEQMPPPFSAKKVAGVPAY